MMQMGQVSRCDEKHLLPQARHVAEAIGHRTLGAKPRCVFQTQNETVNALKGDVPEGSLERLGEPSRYFDRRLECVDERAAPSAM